MNPNDNNQKMLDRDLRDFPVPEPPKGLLEKIQAEIPDAATLSGESAGSGAAPRRWPLRLAATIALAVVGATVAWQVAKSRQGHELDRQAAEFTAPTGTDEGSRFATAAPPPPRRRLRRRHDRPGKPRRQAPTPARSRRPRTPLLKAFR